MSAFQERIRAFVKAHVEPVATQMDREQEMCSRLLRALMDQGFFGLTVPSSYGGGEIDALELGILHEEVGAVCGSTRSLLTVHQMAIASVLRFGTEAQKARWLPDLCSGDVIGAFALTEERSGSDAGAIETQARKVPGGWSLKGKKCWISFGGLAQLLIVIAQTVDGPQAFLVPGSVAGIRSQRVRDLIGYRGSMVCHVEFEDCVIEEQAALGQPGMGFSLVALNALDLGRFTVAWGCVGAARASLQSTIAHVRHRESKGQVLIKHALVRRNLSQMVVALQASKLLCVRAAQLRLTGSPASISETMLAKYVAGQALARVSSLAVHMHGAVGLTSEHAVERHYREAKIAELIEGSNEVLELAIADFADGFARLDTADLY